MAYETRELTGALFKNDEKTTDAHPNARGKCLINGRLYYISAWTKTSQGGMKYQSLAFKPANGDSKPDNPADDGEIPF